MIRTISLVVTLLFSLCSMACAHDLWIQQAGNELEVVTGHEGAAISCDPSKIKEIKVFDSDGALKKTATSFQGKAALTVEKIGIAAVIAHQEEGFRSVTPEGEKALSKREAKDAVETKYYQNTIKTLRGWSAAYSKPLGSKFEIVPLQNPFTLKTGDTFPIAVYYDGKPLDGAWVGDGTTDGLREKTDNEGRITVTVGKKGRQFISAFRDEHYKDPADADMLSMTTNLSYVVP